MLNYFRSIKTLLFISTFNLACYYYAFAFIVSDSTKENKKERQSTLRTTSRIHSNGMFMYAGRVVTNNPSWDINFSYERSNWGYSFFKALDLYNLQSPNNFVLTTFYRNFRLGEKFTIKPHVAFVLEQTHGIAGKGSDAGVITISAYKINKKFTVDHTALVANVMLEQKTLDWINRFRLLYSHKHADATVFLWHNNDVFDHSNYLSCGLNAAYSRIKLSEHVLLSTGITGIVMIATSDENSFPKRNGLVLTIAVVAIN